MGRTRDKLVQRFCFKNEETEKKMKGNGVGRDGCLLVQDLQFPINNKTFSREQDKRGYIWEKLAYPGIEMTFILNGVASPMGEDAGIGVDFMTVS